MPNHMKISLQHSLISNILHYYVSPPLLYTWTYLFFIFNLIASLKKIFESNLKWTENKSYLIFPDSVSCTDDHSRDDRNRRHILVMIFFKFLNLQHIYQFSAFSWFSWLLFDRYPGEQRWLVYEHGLLTLYPSSVVRVRKCFMYECDIASFTTFIFWNIICSRCWLPCGKDHC